MRLAFIRESICGSRCAGNLAGLLAAWQAPLKNGEPLWKMDATSDTTGVAGVERCEPPVRWGRGSLCQLLLLKSKNGIDIDREG